MRELLNKGLRFVFLGLLCTMAACAPPAAVSTPAAPPLPSQPGQASSPALLQETKQTGSTAEAAPTPTPPNELDAAPTFEAIAAVHANMLEIQGWLPNGLSVFERQAIVQPIAEISMAPLTAIYAEYAPPPALAESWQQASQLQQDFYPRLIQWVEGALGDAEFSVILAELLARSTALMVRAELAAGQLGIDTSQYGADYSLARGIVFRLAPGNVGQLPGVVPAQGPTPERRENPDLVVRQLKPFVHPFAGMDVLLTVGLLENTGSRPQQGVEVEIRFYNFLGEHLGTMLGRLLAQTALPGGVYPFSASIVTEGEETALKDWAEVQVSVFSHPAADEVVSYQDFDLGFSSASSNGTGGAVVEGTLTNRGGQAVERQSIRIGVMAFDIAGELVGVGNGFVAAGEDLLPGESASFQAVLEALSGEPVSFLFFAEAGQ